MVIAKISSIGCYEKTITYVFNRDKQPKIIGHNLSQLVVDGGTGKIIKEFRETFKKAIAPYRIVKPCSHISLSLAPEDREIVDDELMREIGELTLERMGFTNNQYIIVKHGVGKLTEKHNHDHQHIIINRVREDGYVTRRYWEQTKLNKVMRTIEKECGLRELTNYQEMGFKGCDRQYKLYLMEKSQNNRYRSIKKFIIQTQLYEQINKDDNQGIDIVEFLAKLEKDETIELRLWDKNKDDNWYKLEEVKERLINGENLGISYGCWDEVNNTVIAFAGWKLGQLATIEGLKGYLAGEEKYRQLKIPAMLKKYSQEVLGKDIEVGVVGNLQEVENITLTRETMPKIPVQREYQEYWLEQNRQIWSTEDKLEEKMEIIPEPELESELINLMILQHKLKENIKRTLEKKQPKLKGQNTKAKDSYQLE
jgi:hypothetical protein